MWPYTPRQATYLKNCLPDKGDASSPLEMFSNVTVVPKLKEINHLGALYMLSRIIWHEEEEEEESLSGNLGHSWA